MPLTTKSDRRCAHETQPLHALSPRALCGNAAPAPAHGEHLPGAVRGVHDRPGPARFALRPADAAGDQRLLPAALPLCLRCAGDAGLLGLRVPDAAKRFRLLSLAAADAGVPLRLPGARGADVPGWHDCPLAPGRLPGLRALRPAHQPVLRSGPVPVLHRLCGARHGLRARRHHGHGHAVFRVHRHGHCAVPSALHQRAGRRHARIRRAHLLHLGPGPGVQLQPEPSGLGRGDPSLLRRHRRPLPGGIHALWRGHSLHRRAGAGLHGPRRLLPPLPRVGDRGQERAQLRPAARLPLRDLAARVPGARGDARLGGLAPALLGRRVLLAAIPAGARRLLHL